MAISLSPGFHALALDLQEAATELSHGNIRDHLQNAVDDAAGAGGYGYVMDVFGDDDSGDVIHRTNGQTLKSKYSFQQQGSKRKATIKDGKPVTARVVYDEQPKQKESKVDSSGPLKLVESWDWKENALQLVEATGGVRMPIKLISPGKGSSAFYPAEVLKRDGPNVFTKGTHIYINHATAAEEAARPEGDWHKLVGALESNAYWDEKGKAGAGLYGMGLFTREAAPLIKEKAPFTGMSIRASGIAESNKKQDGLPILKELTSAESVDVVTRAGAGGLILSESAKDKGDLEMTPEEIKALVESASKQAVEAALAQVSAPVKLLEARALRGDAVAEAHKIIAPYHLPDAAKTRIVEAVTRDSMPTKDGALDIEAFRTVVISEAKREAEYVAQLTGAGRVIGMGPTLLPERDPKELAEAEARRVAEAKREDEEDRRIFSDISGLPLKEVA